MKKIIKNFLSRAGFVFKSDLIHPYELKAIEDSFYFNQKYLGKMPESCKNGNFQSFKRPLFIDFGTNLGQGFDFFSKYFSPYLYDYIFVEPAPESMKRFKEKFQDKLLHFKSENNNFNFKFIEEAASDQDGYCKLYGLNEDQRGNTNDGASINAQHNSKYYKSNEEKSIKVKTFCTSNFIKKQAVERDLIIIKMDIEGAEYKVLENIIENNVLDKIDRIYIEWHSKFFSNKFENKYKNWEKKLKSKLGTKAVEWY